MKSLKNTYARKIIICKSHRNFCDGFFLYYTIYSFKEISLSEGTLLTSIQNRRLPPYGGRRLHLFRSYITESQYSLSRASRSFLASDSSCTSSSFLSSALLAASSSISAIRVSAAFLTSSFPAAASPAL